MLRKENASHKLFNLDKDVQHLIEEGFVLIFSVGASLFTKLT